MLGGLAALGLIASALVEFVKDVLPIRRVWNQQWLGFHVDGHRHTQTIATVIKLVSGRPSKRAERVLSDISQLSGAGHRASVYACASADLIRRLERMMALAIQNPASHEDFISAFLPAERVPTLHRLLALHEEYKQLAISESDDASAARAAKLKAQIEAEEDDIIEWSTITFAALGEAMASSWKKLMNALASLISILIILIVAGSKASGVTLLLGLAGGYLAPFVKDVHKAVQGVSSNRLKG